MSLRSARIPLSPGIPSHPSGVAGMLSSSLGKWSTGILTHTYTLNTVHKYPVALGAKCGSWSQGNADREAEREENRSLAKYTHILTGHPLYTHTFIVTPTIRTCCVADQQCAGMWVCASSSLLFFLFFFLGLFQGDAPTLFCRTGHTHTLTGKERGVSAVTLSLSGYRE